MSNNISHTCRATLPASSSFTACSSTASALWSWALANRIAASSTTASASGLLVTSMLITESGGGGLRCGLGDRGGGGVGASLAADLSALAIAGTAASGDTAGADRPDAAVTKPAAPMGSATKLVKSSERSAS